MKQINAPKAEVSATAMKASQPPQTSAMKGLHITSANPRFERFTIDRIALLTDIITPWLQEQLSGLTIIGQHVLQPVLFLVVTTPAESAAQITLAGL
jgi:hypothetical protein